MLPASKRNETAGPLEHNRPKRFAALLNRNQLSGAPTDVKLEMLRGTVERGDCMGAVFEPFRNLLASPNRRHSSTDNLTGE